uniref:PDZ domain-containing protein n=2 Tax=Timema TaxID=61471 RepID=A0A7R9EVB3_9NEOP|nr:unnamed protein product [Timema bartmani]
MKTAHLGKEEKCGENPMHKRQHQALSRALSVPETPTLYSTSLHSTPSSGSSGRSDNNVTVIEVSSEQLPPSNEQGIFNFSFIADSLVPPLDATTSNTTFSEDLNTQEVNELYYTPPVTPARPSDRSSRTSTVSVLSNASAQISLNSGEVRIQERTNPSNINNNSLDTEPLSVLNSHYECVFLSPIINSPIIREDLVSVSTGTTTRIQHGSAIPEDNSNSRLPETSRNQPGNSLVEEQSQVVPSSQEPSTGDHQMRRRRSSSTSEGNLAQHVPTRPITVPGSERSRIILGGTSPRVEVERRLQPAPHPYRQVQQATPGGSVELVGSNRLTLREQQVLQLRREMLHPGGVRLQLRRKDCTGSIALVDAFGAVWVAGWKQREHPMLYNALHIGDQVLSTAGIMVQSAADAQKLIRGATSLYVEFIIRRVPFGRVFAIRRDTEGQSLGIIQEGNTAEIRDIVSGSPAARHGLSPRAQTCDGLSLTNWVLTEINGRPLNLFFKDAEVRDRLNAVGREISILVQPFDLVRQLKKQLKAIRGYKDYILQ